MLLIILKHASVYRSVAEGELSESFSHIVCPLSFVLLTVEPDLATIPILYPIYKFTFKEATIFLKNLFVVLAFHSFAFQLSK